MIIKTNTIASALISTALLLSGPSGATALPDQAQEKTAQSQAAQDQAQKSSSHKLADQRSKISKESIAAIESSQKALQALEAGKTDEALKALEAATGKLELILARNPDLALVPVNVDMVTYDLFADADTVEAAVAEAKELLDDGEVQQARHLIANLASEVVISTTSIPLATYPDAIKAISPLLDKGETAKAKAALEAALNTLVITREIIPLPLLRSQYMLAQAEELAKKKDRSKEDSQLLDDLLAAAKHELKLAEALGYGHSKSFKPLYEQIRQIKEKSEDGKSGSGWFDKIKQQLSDLF